MGIGSGSVIIGVCLTVNQRMDLLVVLGCLWSYSSVHLCVHSLTSHSPFQSITYSSVYLTAHSPSDQQSAVAKQWQLVGSSLRVHTSSGHMPFVQLRLAVFPLLFLL